MKILIIDDETQELLNEIKSVAINVYQKNDLTDEKLVFGILKTYGEEIIADMNDYGAEANNNKKDLK